MELINKIDIEEIKEEKLMEPSIIFNFYEKAFREVDFSEY